MKYKRKKNYEKKFTYFEGQRICKNKRMSKDSTDVVCHIYIR